MLREIVEESSIFELARQYGEERGFQKAQARGRQGLRAACLSLTKEKAPRLVSALESHLRRLTSLRQLEKLIIDLGLAKSEKEVEIALDPQARSSQEELAEGLRRVCLALTKAKAPEQEPVLEGHIGDIDDLEQLTKLVIDLGLADDEEDVRSTIADYFE